MAGRAVLTAGVVLVGAGILAGAPAAALRSQQAGCSAEAGTKIESAGMYRFALHFGAAERMYTLAEVRKLHPATGEVMVGGAMMSMPAMGMNANSRHVEVQICKSATGSVLKDAMPGITMTDLANGATIKVPVAKMQGVHATSGDIHYGNNVTVKPGHRYRVDVRAMSVRARFVVKAG